MNIYYFFIYDQNSIAKLLNGEIRQLSTLIINNIYFII